MENSKEVITSLENYPLIMNFEQTMTALHFTEKLLDSVIDDDSVGFPHLYIDDSFAVSKLALIEWLKGLGTHRGSDDLYSNPEDVIDSKGACAYLCNLDRYPMFLHLSDIQRIMGMSCKRAEEFIKEENFDIFLIDDMQAISKYQLINWLSECHNRIIITKDKEV